MLRAFDTTGIGSLPHKEVDEAIGLILRNTTVPFWPQLPRRSALEQMVPQYSEGLPGITIHEDRTVIEPSEEEMNRFYEEYSEEKDFPISRRFAEGLYRFLEISSEKDLTVVKGQTTGPVTLSLALRSSDGRPVYYDELYREILLMVLRSKTRWQIRRLREVSKGVIIFIDEPILTALGTSSYLSVNQEEAMNLIKEIVQTIKKEGAIAGLHCCGRADWAEVLKTGIDILNFDAYGYFDSLKASADVLERFISEGGVLAWGIVPTTEAINSEDRDSLLKRFEDYVKELREFISEEDLLRNSILTPSCGAGSRTVSETEKVFRLLQELREALR